MSKIDIEALKFIIQRNEPDIKITSAIMREIAEELKAEEEEKAAHPPAVKKQNVILVSDPGGSLKGKDIVGWIAQIPEDDDIATTASRIHNAAYEFNTTPKGIRAPVETIGEACEVIPAKFFKGQNIWIKTKQPLLIISVDNKIPSE